MQQVKCFTATLDEFGEYDFDEEFFPANRSPTEYIESNKGRMTKLFSQTEGDITYAIYGHGEFTQSQFEQVERDWSRHLNKPN